MATLIRKRGNIAMFPLKFAYPIKKALAMAKPLKKWEYLEPYQFYRLRLLEQ